MGQTEDEVYKRVSGGKLHYWLSLHDAATRHWPYAWAAVAAYQDLDDEKAHPLQTTPECPHPTVFLPANNWVLWDDLPLLGRKDPPGSPGDVMRTAHLRATVWANQAQRKIIVAFGGTAWSSAEDWKSDLRWFLAPLHLDDEYEVLSGVFVPLLASTYARKAAQPGGEWLEHAEVIASGHSLGAGLAQRFAYSWNLDARVPRVREVYAFDPSPVSGKREVQGWEQAAEGLRIYRIYNRGEILASVRSILNLYEDPPQAQGQHWIDIRYRNEWSWRTLLPAGSVHAHRIFGIACKMKEAAKL